MTSRIHLCLLLAVSCATHAIADDSQDFFEKRIRPLLLKHCVSCHGNKKQESGLRLDSREGWVKGGDRGPAIIPGQPEKSLLLKVVTKSAEEDLAMPPEGNRLTPRDISDLQKWIQLGAVDPRVASTTPTQRLSESAAKQFWSFQPVQRPQLPQTDSTWIQSPIDVFVLRSMQRHGISPARFADKRTLIRRAYFDLTGLPPRPADISAFIEDSSPDAFERVIDKLLGSKAYGERWGRHWLDVARYADTAGDGSDYPVREAYKYRDWVIQSLNDDMPFNEFIRDQIAGDVRAKLAWQSGKHDRKEFARQITATGFLAIGKRYGYKPSPDYQHLDFADVIDSVGRSLLGLSIGCARCHDHKYDPISASDYYAMYGIFQSTKWAFPGGEEHKRPAHFPSLAPAAEVKRLTAIRDEKLKSIDAELVQLKKAREQIDPRWRAGGEDLDFESQQTGKPPGKPWVHSGPIEIRSDAQSPFQHIHPSGQQGIRIGSGLPNDGLRYVFAPGLKAAPGNKMYFAVDFRTAKGAKEKGGYRFYLGRGVVASIAIECSITPDEFAIKNGKDWQVIRKLETGTWYTLQLTLDPAKKTYSGVVGTTNDLTQFDNKKLGLSWDGVADCFICDAIGHVSGPAPARDLDNLGLRGYPFQRVGSKIERAPAEVARNADRLGRLKDELTQLESRRKLIASTPVVEVAYAVSEGEPVNARLQRRGEPHQLGDEVPRRFINVLGGDRVKGNGSGRLQLAEWLTRKSNPLVARVFVNRVWQWHFGRGLVDTPSDFGSRGSKPSHPQLLDWLASDFVESGWSMKTLHRRIMLSSTYRLSSQDVGHNLKIDPGNVWLWRYARRPLDAESVRDSMLMLSGNLRTTTSNPHPFPDVNTWSFSIHFPFHAVYDSDHRSIYLMVQRNRRHPYLALFDAADPNISVATRKPTTTPTQALYLMNSPFVHRQSEGFAKEIIESSDSDQARVEFAFEAAVNRRPDRSELTDTIDFLKAYRERLGQQASGNQNEWTALARILLTSNRFLFVE